MKKLLLITCLTSVLILPAFAELTVEDTTSKEYLINQGYSKATTNAVQKTVARSNGEPLTEPLEKESYNRPFVKFVRRVFMYLDPSLDDHSFVNDHQIHTSPSYDDL